MKQIKKIEIDSLVFEDDSINDVIKQLEEYKLKYSDYMDLRLDSESSYDGGYYTYLKDDRYETDVEEQLREKREVEYADRNDANLRKQYEALKVKFEPSIKTEQ